MSKVSNTVGKTVVQAMCWYCIFWVGKQICKDISNWWSCRGPYDPEAQYDYEDSPYVDDDYDDEC